MLMPGRGYQPEDYRFGFSGQEKDDEINGSGNLNTAMYWEYDTRLVRRWNVDPLAHLTPWYSPYSTFGNNPILNIDEEGKTKVAYLTIISKGEKTVIKVVDKDYTKTVNVTVPVPTTMGIMNNVEIRQYDVLETQTINLDDPKKSTARKETLLGVTDNLFEKTARKVGSILEGDGGGIVFTSVDGQGQETRIGKGYVDGPINIDDLLGVIGATQSAAEGATAKNILTAIKGFVEAASIGQNLGDAVGTKESSGKSSGDTICTNCNTAGNHGYGFKTRGKTFDDKGKETKSTKTE